MSGATLPGPKQGPEGQRGGRPLLPEATLANYGDKALPLCSQGYGPSQ